MKYYLAALMTAFCLQGFAADEPQPLSPDIALDPSAAVEALDTDAMPTDVIDNHHQRSHHKACAAVKLDDKQKADVKEALYNFKKERITQKAALKLAALEYGKVLGSATTEKGAANRAAVALNEGVSKLVASSTAFVNDVFFRILKPEQREAGLECLKAMKRHRRHHHHGHGHHGHGHHHGGGEFEAPEVP